MCDPFVWVFGLGAICHRTCPFRRARREKILPGGGPVQCIKGGDAHGPRCLHGLTRVAMHARATEKSIQRRFLSFARRWRNKKLGRRIKQTVAGIPKEDCDTSFRRLSNGALRQDTFEADYLSARIVWNSLAFFREFTAQANSFSLVFHRLKHSISNTRLDQ